MKEIKFQTKDTSFTPGPWMACEHTDGSGIEIGVPYSEKWMKSDKDDEGNEIPDCGFRTHDVCGISAGRRFGVHDTMRANALLIAAAPDLLEVAKLVVQWLDDNGLKEDQSYGARAAIKKALGQ